jgi:hypothetical protein
MVDNGENTPILAGPISGRLAGSEKEVNVMRRLLFRISGLCLAPLVGLALLHGSELNGKSAKPVVKEKTEGACGSHGTRIDFVDTPSQAAKIARKEQKLVFVLHVSGNFEDPRFT